ncbi:MAG: DUF1963 domain-containing protein [Desulfuromonadaceae bacterium]
MSNAILEKLLNPGLSTDDLRGYANKTNEINKKIAAHPNVDSTLLDELLEFWGEDDEGIDVGVVVIALRNPAISLEKLIRFGRDNPEAVLENPSFAEILKKEPNLYKKIPEILQQINCPEKLLIRAAKQKKEEYWPNILVNPIVPVSLVDDVNPNNLFAFAKQRLQDFKDKASDEIVEKYLDLYLNTVRPFFVPRFLNFDKNIREHRLSDQVLCGFPYTSQKWSWPVGSNGLHMQPVAQINLENVGKLLRLPLGTGLLQIWGCVGMGLRDHSIRIIPTQDLSDVLDDFYPPDAAWLKVDYEGAPEFEKCIVSSFTLDDYRPFRVEKCRVEWVDMGYMFYPSVYKRIFSPLRQDDCNHQFDDDSNSWTLAEKLDEKIDKLRLPTGLNPYGNRLFVLGGYGDGLGNAWHTDDGDLILYHSVDYGYKITIALYCKSDDIGPPVFVVNINGDN